MWSARAGTVVVVTLAVIGSACGDEVADPSLGTLQVEVRVSGEGSDPDGFRIAVDGTGATATGLPQTPVFFPVSPGSHQIVLGGVAANCLLAGDEVRSATVSAGDTSGVLFEVSCEPAAGEIQITTASDGSDIDPSGYLVLLDSVPRVHLQPTGSVTLAVTAGAHEIALTGVTPNCSVEGGNARQIEVPAASSMRLDFAISCETAPPAGHGNEIAFVSTPPDSQRARLYVMNADGTGVRPLLPDSPGNQIDPDWALDGDRLVYASDNLTFLFELQVFNLGSASPVELDIGGEFGKVDPRWSPDGTRIAYTQVDDTQSDDVTFMQLVTIRADGSSPQPVGVFPFDNTEHPTWSPDGSRLAFTFVPIDFVDFGAVLGPASIYVVGPDGSALRILVPPSMNAIHPAWSPDGGRIAFSSNGDLYLVGAEGGEPTQLTSGPGADRGPAWAPDGSKIAFSSDRDGNSEIYVVDVTGENPTRLTNNPADDSSPAWRP
jgi:Tol biopolymer transport system component